MNPTRLAGALWAIAAAGFFSVDALAEMVHLPPELIYDGAPIEPYCFSDIDEKLPTTLELTDCGPENVSHRPLHLDEDHSVCYESKPDADEGLAFFTYCYIGKYQGSALLVTQDGGRNGWTTVSLMALKRTSKETAVVSYLAKGETGYGGVADAVIKNGHLFYDKNIGAWDFLDIAGDNPHQLVNWKDLGGNDTRMVDFGLAHYEDQALVSIALKNDDFTKDNKDVTPHFRYQSCFNKVFNDYIKNGKTSLLPNELKEFTRRFNALCIELAKQ